MMRHRTTCYYCCTRVTAGAHIRWYGSQTRVDRRTRTGTLPPANAAVGASLWSVRAPPCILRLGNSTGRWLVLRRGETGYGQHEKGLGTRTLSMTNSKCRIATIRSARIVTLERSPQSFSSSPRSILSSGSSEATVPESAYASTIAPTQYLVTIFPRAICLPAILDSRPTHAGCTTARSHSAARP